VRPQVASPRRGYREDKGAKGPKTQEVNGTKPAPHLNFADPKGRPSYIGHKTNPKPSRESMCTPTLWPEELPGTEKKGKKGGKNVTRNRLHLEK